MAIAIACACGKQFNVGDQYQGQRIKCPGCGNAVLVPGVSGSAAAPPQMTRSSVAPPPLTAQQRYTLAQFIERTSERDHGQGKFELESERILELNLNGMVWTKKGSMIAYLGDVKFTREGILEHGIGRFLKKSISGEGVRLTKAEGTGKVYLADSAKKISIIELENESLFVNGNDLLAFEPTVKWDIKMLKRIASMLAGGLFNVKLEGSGMVAITTHYEPLTLVVSPGRPVYTDPNATVAWSGSLSPDLKTDISLKTLFGRGSGESLQMKFEGNGFVVVQPYEEVYHVPG